MSKSTAGIDRYSHQRPKVTPPHVGLADLRMAVGISQDAICDRIAEMFGEDQRPTKGAISGIENGHRGASERLLRQLALAYGMREDAITTTYVPREREPKAVA